MRYIVYRLECQACGATNQEQTKPFEVLDLPCSCDKSNIVQREYETGLHGPQAGQCICGCMLEMHPIVWVKDMMHRGPCPNDHCQGFVQAN